MKRFLRLIAPAVALALCNLLLLVSARAYAAGDGWYTSLREAEEVALREGKPILADFSTSWCGSCRDLERKTFPHPYVRARMDRFVKVHVDGDDNPDLVKSYAISGYPTLIAMSPGGKELNRTVGYVDASELSSDLDQAMRKYDPPAPKGPANAKAAPPGKSDGSDGVAVASVSESKSSSRRNSREVASVPVRREGSKGGGYSADEDSYSSREPDREINYYTLSEETRAVSFRPKERALASVSARPVVSAAVSQAVDIPVRETQTEAVSLQRDRVVRIARDEPEALSLAEASPAKDAGEKADTAKPSENVASPSPKPVQGASTTSRDLPRPMINVSGRDAEFSQSGPSPSSKAAPPVKPVASRTKAADDDDVEPKSASAPSAKDPESVAPSKVSLGASGGILGTIHKLADQTPQPGEKATAGKSLRSDDISEDVGEAPSVRKVAEEKPEEPKKSSKSEKTTSKKSVDEPAPARKVASDETKPKSSGRSAQVPSSDEVGEWIRVAEGHQAARRWKEARAMYQRVVERDPKNVNGQTDLAFIRMCALMVTPDQADNDKVRLEAYNKIREFIDRFGNSRHMDYYTVTRADLAADLGKQDEARNLLADFPERYPNSRYLSWARDSWDRLAESSSASKSKSANSRSTSKSSN